MSMPKPVVPSADALLQRYLQVRAQSLKLCMSLAPEDTVVQSMPDVSPTKWHLAHVSWFFEQFILARQPGYRLLHADWMFLFNSYYESMGPRHARVARGLLSRPTLHEILDYRARVDDRMAELIAAEGADPVLEHDVELGLQHEQQHQELILTDIKHVLSVNPLQPAYQRLRPGVHRQAPPLRFVPGVTGLAMIGASGEQFAFDCETPQHQVLLHPHALASRPVTNGEYREFVRAGGYREPRLWLSEGWAAVQTRGWTGPMYWDESGHTEFTLNGRLPIDHNAPVCHVSYYEADAFARWAGARLPTEAEWEAAASAVEERAMDVGHFADRGVLQPQVAPKDGLDLHQLFGDVWEWTSSAYVNYPGFRPLPGALGEYNGKFMCGQWILRGGSCVSPAGHLRSSYRNFFYPPDRWQFMGLRLARDL